MAFDSGGPAENSHPNRSDHDSLFGDGLDIPVDSGAQSTLPSDEQIPVWATSDSSTRQHVKDEPLDNDVQFLRSPFCSDVIVISDDDEAAPNYVREATVSKSKPVGGDHTPNLGGCQETTANDESLSPQGKCQPLGAGVVEPETTMQAQQTQQYSSLETSLTGEAVPSKLNDSSAVTSGVEVAKFKLRRRNTQGRPTGQQMEALREAFIRKRFEQRSTDALTTNTPGVIRGDARSSSLVDRNAWMSSEITDDVEDVAAIFAERKAEYEAKQRHKSNTMEDDVVFIRATRKEETRLGKIAKNTAGVDEVQDRDEMELDVNQDSRLFLPEVHPSSISHKRLHAASIQDRGQVGGEDVLSSDEETSSTNKRRRPEPSKTTQMDNQMEEAMLNRIAEDLAKDKDEDSEQEKTKKRSSKGNAPKSKPSKPRRKHHARRRRAGEHASTSNPFASRPDLMSNFNSLFSSNVLADGNANLGKAGQPILIEKRKQDALRDLLVSVPLENQSEANRDRRHILQATIDLGKRKVCPDPETGLWKLNGMATTLHNHQVQGAAWMRNRETGGIEPLGGLCADEMGLGKTVMMIANMIANPPLDEDIRSGYAATLIIGTPGLVAQWRAEIKKHAGPGRLQRIVIYDKAMRSFGQGVLDHLRNAEVILTTYNQVMRSYPRFDPPEEIREGTEQERIAWWVDYCPKNLGILHRIKYYRIVLDECQAIKNHLSQTSVACRGLKAKHKWLLSGTPIQNSVSELYPNNDEYNGRVQAFLRIFMIRRTHQDSLLGQPLIVLPRNYQEIEYLDFNETERAVYDIVAKRFRIRIMNCILEGGLEKRYAGFLIMLLRLRQLTTHLFMIQEVLEDLVESEDIEELWNLTVPELAVPDAYDISHSVNRDMLIQMKKILAKRNAPANTTSGENKDGKKSLTSKNVDEEKEAGKAHPLVLGFREQVQRLRESSNWTALNDCLSCHKCGLSPRELMVTSCLHAYCKDCLVASAHEAAQKGQDHASCLECGCVYTESTECHSLEDLGLNNSLNLSHVTRTQKNQRRQRLIEDYVRWTDFNGKVIGSAKTRALMSQVEAWQKEDPQAKIIIFTQFHTMIEVVGRMCVERGWLYCTYHGKMSNEERDEAIQDFGTVPELRIMINSLKCGGIGLNLTMASRVISLDLWWNSSVEQQAFCRAYRIGQEKETYFKKYVVRNTVDERIQNMQDRKEGAIEAALGERSGKKLAQHSLVELMELFGPIPDKDRQFILCEEDEIPPFVDPDEVEERKKKILRGWAGNLV